MHTGATPGHEPLSGCWGLGAGFSALGNRRKARGGEREGGLGRCGYFEAWLGEASVGGMGDPREGVDTLEATAGECEQRLVTLEAAFSGEQWHLLRTAHNEQQTALLVLSSSEDTVMMEKKLSSKGLLRSLLVKGGRCAAEGDGISIFNGFFTSTDTLLPAFFLHGTLKLGEVPEKNGKTELDSFSPFLWRWSPLNSGSRTSSFICDDWAGEVSQQTAIHSQFSVVCSSALAVSDTQWTGQQLAGHLWVPHLYALTPAHGQWSFNKKVGPSGNTEGWGETALGCVPVSNLFCC